jgi:ATP adenylyltransferase
MIELIHRSNGSFEHGTLRRAAAGSSVRALQNGALQPISTTLQFVEDDGVNFIVRMLEQNVEQSTPTSSSPIVYPKCNPFLPYDPALFVADLTDTHACLLNKFTVLPDHMLIVTRSFEHQEQWLTRADFEALWTCFVDCDGLGFYNGGPRAGASQPHKHLQYVPFPLVPTGPDIPIEALLPEGPTGSISVLPTLPFSHAFVRFSRGEPESDLPSVDLVYETYASMLSSVGFAVSGVGQGGRQTGAYNLLATRRWMLIVPRRQSGVGGIAVNALGFAGHLLARSSEQVDEIRRQGPLAILRAVGLPG